MTDQTEFNRDANLPVVPFEIAVPRVGTRYGEVLVDGDGEIRFIEEHPAEEMDYSLSDFRKILELAERHAAAYSAYREKEYCPTAYWEIFDPAQLARTRTEAGPKLISFIFI
ncbi:MAG: hypothetical protein DRI69_10065 [Bacteroidetes bacterium]|nr:MAG: hypothetical protein DRI69_10065 [Bacteroidota bacterium]